MELNRALAIAEVSQVIINSAKVELQFLEMTKGQAADSEFLAPKKALTAATEQPAATGQMRVVGGKGERA